MKEEIEEVRLLIDEIYFKSKNHISLHNTIGFKNLEKILGILILVRLVGNLNSSRLLLSHLWDNPNIEPSIGLILRNNLSLCKIVFKHSELIDNNANLDNFYRTVFGENIQRTIKYVKRNHTQEELQPYLEVIKKNNAFLLNRTGLDIDNIENEKFDLKFNLSEKFNSLENLFILFSKYEHFGLNTIILQGNNEWENKLERIKISIHYSLQGIMICLLMLEVVDDELIQLNSRLAKKTNA